MTQHKVLFPTDFSTSSSFALPTIKERVRLKNSEVHLLFVAEDLTNFESYWGSGLDQKHQENLQEFAERLSKKRLQEICDCELQGCKNYELHFAHGNTSDEILKAIKEFEVDEVVVAKPPTEGESSFGAAVERIIDEAPVVVTAVDAPNPTGAPSCSDR